MFGLHFTILNLKEEQFLEILFSPSAMYAAHVDLRRQNNETTMCKEGKDV